ncbi:12276_t:CDS:1, partial [Racocetra fulgida]
MKSSVKTDNLSEQKKTFEQINNMSIKRNYGKDDKLKHLKHTKKVKLIHSDDELDYHNSDLPSEEEALFSILNQKHVIKPKTEIIFGIIVSEK